MDWNSMLAHIQERRSDLMREAQEERLTITAQGRRRFHWRHNSIGLFKLLRRQQNSIPHQPECPVSVNGVKVLKEF